MSFKSFYRISGSLFNNKYSPFISNSYNQLCKRLNYLIEIGGVGVITGDSGSGKSYLLLKYLDSLDSNCYNHSVVNILHNKATMIISAIATEFKIKNTFVDNITIILIREYLKSQRSKNIKHIFVIENADRLKPEVLDTIKEIIEILEVTGCIFILVGQEKLNLSIQEAILSELKTRVMINYTVLPLSEEETRLYIKHRFNEVYVSDDILTPSAYKAIYKLTLGLPRQINALLGRCLLIGEAMSAKQINEEVVMLSHDDSL